MREIYVVYLKKLCQIFSIPIKRFIYLCQIQSHNSQLEAMANPHFAPSLYPKPFISIQPNPTVLLTVSIFSSHYSGGGDLIFITYPKHSPLCQSQFEGQLWFPRGRTSLPCISTHCHFFFDEQLKSWKVWNVFSLFLSIFAQTQNNMDAWKTLPSCMIWYDSARFSQLAVENCNTWLYTLL